MHELGINISEQKITQVTPELLEESALVVVLTDEELPEYFQNFGDRVVIMPVEDPAPGDTQDVETEKMRMIRDQIGEFMSQIELSYLKHGDIFNDEIVFSSESSL